MARRACDLVDQHVERACRPCARASRADALLHRHEARAALLAHLVGHRIGQRVGRRALDRRVGEAADAVELRLARGTASSSSNSASVSPGKPTMNVLRIVSRGTAARQARMRSSVRSRQWPGASSASGCAGSRAGTARRGRAGSLPVGHQRDHLVDVRIRIDVVQAHPHAELARAPRARARSCASSAAARPRSRCGTSRRRRRRSCPAR